jgi:hypothetical protein
MLSLLELGRAGRRVAAPTSVVADRLQCLSIADVRLRSSVAVQTSAKWKAGPALNHLAAQPPFGLKMEYGIEILNILAPLPSPSTMLI